MGWWNGLIATCILFLFAMFIAFVLPIIWREVSTSIMELTNLPPKEQLKWLLAIFSFLVFWVLFAKA